MGIPSRVIFPHSWNLRLREIPFIVFHSSIYIPFHCLLEDLDFILDLVGGSLWNCEKGGCEGKNDTHYVSLGIKCTWV